MKHTFTHKSQLFDAYIAGSKPQNCEVTIEHGGKRYRTDYEQTWVKPKSFDEACIWVADEILDAGDQL